MATSAMSTQPRTETSQDSVPKQAQSESETLAINAIRTLSIDAVEAANSGHPGTPMALAPLAYVLWNEFLRYDPEHADWPDRDRFILSNGHASMLLYSVLHLAKVKSEQKENETHVADGSERYAVNLDDIRAFRQLDSRCPGHPEYGITTGVECTTGPLGQGVANSVGMAIASRWYAARFNRSGLDVFKHRVWAICGDGCLMEGVSGEAASLAGHLKLANLCWIYDSNHITIEGSTQLAFTENVAERFSAYGWRIDTVKDANDLGAIRRALSSAQAEQERPTLIILTSQIGYGAPHKQNTRAAHGEALGKDEVKLAKEFYKWPSQEPFFVPEKAYEAFAKGIGQRGPKEFADWQKVLETYDAAQPTLFKDLEQTFHREFTANTHFDDPTVWDKLVPAFPADAKGLATRESSSKILNAVAQKEVRLIGGSADLYPSTKTFLKFDSAGTIEADSAFGQNMHFGIREHAMGSIVNGLALSGLRPYGSTFLIFSDYMKPPIRLSALMELPCLWIFTHDSIGIGEDGPTHQPVEQLVSLRSIPGLVVLRPADANETRAAWQTLLNLKKTPVALILTRQSVPTLDLKVYPALQMADTSVAKGGYILRESTNPVPKAILIGTGSEVHLCLSAASALEKKGIPTRVVSLPSWELFEKQPLAYRDAVLPPNVHCRVSVEQASTMGWHRYVGLEGRAIGMTSFGASAPIKDLLEKFGFTVEKITAAVEASL